MASDFFSALAGEPEPGYIYGDLLPLRRRNAPGAPLEPGIPSALRDAAHGLADALSLPREVMLGHVSQEALPERGVRMAGELMGAGMGVPAPGGMAVARVFGGPLAHMADTKALGQALTLESRLRAQKYAPDAIRDAVHSATGWFRGADDKWRFEIPDSGAKLKYSGAADPARPLLGDALHHPKLFSAYPDLANVEIAALPEGAASRGSYNHGGNLIALNPEQSDESMLSTLLHEGQHAIQAREDFAYGGTPKAFMRPEWGQDYDEALRAHEFMNDKLMGLGYDPAKVNAAVRAQQNYGTPIGGAADEYSAITAVHPEVFDQWLNSRNALAQLHGERENAWNLYNGLAGEVEARLAQARHREGDYGNPPWSSSAWVDPADQIVQFREGK